MKQKLLLLDKPTPNKVIYTTELIRKNVLNNPFLIVRLESNSLFGFYVEPKSSKNGLGSKLKRPKPDMTKLSFIVKGLSIENDGEDNYLMGEIEPTDTLYGKMIETNPDDFIYWMFAYGSLMHKDGMIYASNNYTPDGNFYFHTKYQ